MAILVVEFSSFISSSSSLVNRDGSATTEGEDLLLCFVRRGFLVVKSYLLPRVDVVEGFPEELLLRMPLLDLPPPLTLAGPRKKTEQSGEEVIIYVCVYLLLLLLLLISSSYFVSLSLSEAFYLKN